MKIKKISAVMRMSAFFFSFFIVSCGTIRKPNKDFLYFQRGLDSIGRIQPKETIVKPNDLLSIRVGSRSLNQEQTRLFNMGGADSSSSSYTVSPAGNIELPAIGTIKAAGLTLLQLQTLLTDRLVNYVKDPIVKVKYTQFNVNLLGEFHSPGTKTFVSDNVTILDAIGAGGDLTDDGRREGILVIREENGRRKYYHVDLKSGGLFQSPVYQLQPNDVVYVPANNNKLIAVNQNPVAGKGLTTALTILGIVITLASLTINLTRR